MIEPVKVGCWRKIPALSLETYVRDLRDLVFTVPTTLNNWEHCKENWMKASEIEWLEDKSQRPLKDYSK